MGVAIGDYDGNGQPDIFVTNFARDTNTLYKNLGNMFFVDSTVRPASARFLFLIWMGTSLADLDNDGLPTSSSQTAGLSQVDSLNVGQKYFSARNSIATGAAGSLKRLRAPHPIF